MDSLYMLAAFAPAVLGLLLGRTRHFWLSGAAVLVMAVVALVSIPRGSTSEAGVVNALAGGVLSAVTLGCTVYGILCLVLGRAIRSKDDPPGEPPPADGGWGGG